MKPSDIGVCVKRLAGLGVPQPAGQLDGLDPLLMPQSSPTVPERVGAETEGAHRVTHFVAARDAEWQARFKGGDKEIWGVDDAADALPFGALTFDPYMLNGYIVWLKGQSFRYARTYLIHNNDRKTVGTLDSFQNGNDFVFVGWHGLHPYHAWQLHLPVPSDVRDVSEVQHHAEVADEQTDGAGFISSGEQTYISDDVADADLVDRPVTESVHQGRGTESVALDRAVTDVAPRGKPFSVGVAEWLTADHRPLQFSPRIEGSSEPFPDDPLAYQGFFTCPECSTVLYLRIPAPAPVADVEPAAIPGVPSTNVEGRQ